MHLALVDGLNLVRRIYAGVPGEEGASEHAEAVVESCRRSMMRLLNRLEPTHATVAFEHGGTTWRHELHPGYKAERKPMPDALAKLLPDIESTFAELSVNAIRVEGFEADDVIASIACRVAERMIVTIVSTDKGYLPLVGKGIRIRNHFDDRELDSAYVTERFGVAPDDLATFFALVGDRGNGIPGVPSIGAKMAAKLVQGYGSLERILAATSELSGRTQSALESGKDVAELSLRLVTLRTDVTVGMTLSDFRCRT